MLPTVSFGCEQVISELTRVPIRAHVPIAIRVDVSAPRATYGLVMLDERASTESSNQLAFLVPRVRLLGVVGASSSGRPSAPSANDDSIVKPNVAIILASYRSSERVARPRT